jgi:hypothetical protein
VVTGKLDVRGAVVHLPEEAPCEALAPDDSDGLDEVELSDVEVAA